MLHPDCSHVGGQLPEPTTTSGAAPEPVQEAMFAPPTGEATEDEPTAVGSADAGTTAAARARQAWPAELPLQVKAIAEISAGSPVALTEEALAERFRGRGP